MKFIKPNELAGKIITLIEESDEYTFLISPYVKISKWYKLTKKIDNAIKRNVNLEFVIRDDQNNSTSFEELDSLNYKYTAIPNLHTKLYINEKYAIVTSMNLLLNSEINSLEIGYKTETKEEHQELLDYCKRYLSLEIGGEEQNDSEFDDIKDWKIHIQNSIANNLGRRIKANFNEDDYHFHIYTGKNNYYCFIANEKTNCFRIQGILGGKESDAGYRYIDDLEGSTGLKIEFPESNGHLPAVWGTLEKDLRSKHIENLIDDEKEIIAEKIIEFVTAIDQYKEFLYDQYKMIQDNEKNYFSLLSKVTSMSSIPHKYSRKYRWTKSNVWPKYIYDFNYEYESYKAIVSDIKEEIQSGNYPPASLVRDTTENEALVREFKSQGFTKVKEWSCMCLDLDDLGNDYTMPKDFRVKKVSNTDELKVWLEIVKLEYHIFENIMNEKEIDYFIGYYKDTPVSTAMSFNQYKVSGIYMVVTKNEFRKKGFGTAVTMHALQKAKEDGFNLATLQATVLGESVYKKIGFKEWFKHHFYALGEERKDK